MFKFYCPDCGKVAHTRIVAAACQRGACGMRRVPFDWVKFGSYFLLAEMGLFVCVVIGMTVWKAGPW
jgi:hypothetical protein